MRYCCSVTRYWRRCFLAYSVLLADCVIAQSGTESERLPAEPLSRILPVAASSPDRGEAGQASVVGILSNPATGPTHGVASQLLLPVWQCGPAMRFAAEVRYSSGSVTQYTMRWRPPIQLW